MKKKELSEVVTFLRSWQRELLPILRRAIATEMGYSLDENFQFSHAAPRPAQNYAAITKQHTALGKFGDEFRSLCEKFGISMPQEKTSSFSREGAGSDLPFETINHCLEFQENFKIINTSLERELRALKKKITVRQRRRTPHEVAFEVARAIHFCGGYKGGLIEMKKYLEGKTYLDGRIRLTHLEMKLNAVKWFDQRRSDLKKAFRSARSPAEKRKYRSKMTLLWREEKRVTDDVEISWCFLGSRGLDPNWAHHLKDHLMKLVLSKDNSEVISAIDTLSLRRKKRDLIKEMERRNCLTLQRQQH